MEGAGKCKRKVWSAGNRWDSAPLFYAHKNEASGATSLHIEALSHRCEMVAPVIETKGQSTSAEQPRSGS